MIQIIVIMLKNRAVFKDTEAGHLPCMHSESSSITDPDDSVVLTPGPGCHVCHEAGPSQHQVWILVIRGQFRYGHHTARPEKWHGTQAAQLDKGEEHTWGQALTPVGEKAGGPTIRGCQLPSQRWGKRVQTKAGGTEF